MFSEPNETSNFFYVLSRFGSSLILSNSNLMGKKFKHKQIIFQIKLYIIFFFCTYGCLVKKSNNKCYYDFLSTMLLRIKKRFAFSCYLMHIKLTGGKLEE